MEISTRHQGFFLKLRDKKREGKRVVSQLGRKVPKCKGKTHIMMLFFYYFEWSLTIIKWIFSLSNQLTILLHGRIAFSHENGWLLSADNATIMFVFFHLFFPFLLTFWLANISCCIYRVQYRLAIKFVFAPNKRRYVSEHPFLFSVYYQYWIYPLYCMYSVCT